MPWVRTNRGIALHYRVYGNGGVTIMFLHGWGGDGRVWDRVVAHLDTDRYRCVALDLRGHGRSSCPEAGYTWEDFENDVLSVADRELAGRFVAVGFSAGGKLACHLASRHPERVRAQILAAPVAPGIAPINRETVRQVVEQATDWRQNKSAFRSWFGASVSEEAVDAFSRALAEIPRYVLQATAEMALWTPLPGPFDRLQAPTLVVVGNADPVYHAAYQQQQLLPFLAQSQILAISAGHFIPLECPSELARLISRFVVN